MRTDETTTWTEVDTASESDPLRDEIGSILRHLGEDPAREGLIQTPQRVADSLRFLTAGYHQDVDKVLNGALYSVAYDEMVIVKDIEIFSLCEHHLLPFFGRCHIAYVPTNKVVGLSKLPRLVDVFARRLQVQERLTNQIAETIMDKINPTTGMVLDLKDLKKLLEREVLELVDHRFLNKEVPVFATKIPTTENIAVEIWNLLAPKLTFGRLHRIRLYESPDLYVDYYGEHK